LTRGEAEFQWASRSPGSLIVHERSLVRTLLRQVEEILREYPRARVCRIHVSVGEFAGVEAGLLEPAFEELTHATDLEGARLVVQLEPLEARCRSCHHLFRIMSFHFECPRCQHRALEIVRGEQLILDRVELEEEQEEAS
jgi:hydrogenase nickel incorporation protein HypA/HybF